MNAAVLGRFASDGTPPPTWAILQRALLDRLGDAAQVYLDRFIRADGSLIWRENFPGRDGLDDGYEAYANWPLASSLGASESLAAAAELGWEGVTRQFEEYGQALNGYERGYDWFHQGEGNMLVYGLFEWREGGGTWRERISAFADLFVDEKHGNYDPRTRAFRSPHVGSGGARFGPYRFSTPFTDDVALYEWSERHVPYGLPLMDVDGIERFDDLRNPHLAARMGEAMNARMLVGDTAISLTATGLVARAFAATGEPRFADWVIDYTAAWRERAQSNGGLIPDNVGALGRVGEHHGGRWFGGHYGWQWPHGLEPIASAVTVAATAEQLLTGEDRFDMARETLDTPLREARLEQGQLLVPHRHGPEGWFDWNPMPVRFAAAIWLATHRADDLARLRVVLDATADRFGAGAGPGRFADAHVAGWIDYLAGDAPDYPERVLAESLAEVTGRVAQIRADTRDLTEVHVHHWQLHNPVVTEALIQLTCGGPVPLYNGGLTLTRISYRDPITGRRGLPRDVAALVTSISDLEISVSIVNTSSTDARRVQIVGGWYGEFSLVKAVLSAPAGPADPGEPSPGGRPFPARTTRHVELDDSVIDLELEPGAQVELDLTTTRRGIRR